MKKKNTNFILGTIILILAVFIIGLLINQNSLQDQTNLPNNTITPNDKNLEKKYANLTYSEFQTKKNSPFITITSEELLTLLTTTNAQNSRSMSYKSQGLISAPMAMDDSLAMPESVSVEAGGSNDFSNTNVQVSNIDEGDVVKTDGKHIFIAKNNTITVIDNVTPPIAEENKYTLKIEDDNLDVSNLNIKAMFVNKEEKLLYVISEKQIIESKFTEYSILYPQMNYIPFTVINTYKINDSSLEELSSIETKGNYYESRMKEGIVYIITNDYLYDFRPIAYYDTVMIPVSETKKNVKTNFKPTIVVPRDVTAESKVMYNLTTLSYSKNTSSIIDSIDLILDNSNTLYMSYDNLYIATQKNRYYPFYRFAGNNNNNIDPVFEEIYDKVYPLDVSNKIKDNLEDQDKLIEILNDYYKTLDQKEKEELYNKINDETNKYYEEQRAEFDKTYINKIELKSNGLFGEIIQGEVKGNLLNQFSLDESDSYLRVATTYQDYNGYSSINKNAVTILNSSLKEVGIVDEIAPTERIYSARFMGSKLYLVTYRQVDPFFVIDLSSPTNPEILGYLKISGYSDYLHPISENSILGVGQETEANEWGGENRAGVKVALFDVSDFSNPVEVGKWVSDVRGSSTQVSYDHKAFLYIAKNNLVVIPISEYYNTTTPKFGFVVLKADESGVNEVTTINHIQSNKYYSSLARSLYIDNELYTISDDLLKTYNFDTEEETELPI
ncbi:beta-propeller domain-containing protein [archaeon]|nr:beta-propeller domain-containing protein [archaeon]MDD2477488.1 beta-propeller domain-containing protein [Candidatus ainarchaeum sp.]MDD3084768.1 beta-propeller domain-containing protein [Candidatus ainarchaeum sp.]MDD4221444.1 beta-propeller domain-containing protein [Candidatus ainarchaeum sp.]MDD4662408.1 beta-propeller domain-containing protein [Candidatus ainarchaeum sp.]